MSDKREDLETRCRNVHPYEVLVLDGVPVEIDVELVPLVTALWAAGYETLLSCQNLGEAIQGGGTEFKGSEAEQVELADRTRHLIWLIVKDGQERRLRSQCSGLDQSGWWSQPSDVPGWTSVCIPRSQVAAATERLTA